MVVLADVAVVSPVFVDVEVVSAGAAVDTKVVASFEVVLDDVA